MNSLEVFPFPPPQQTVSNLFCLSMSVSVISEAPNKKTAENMLVYKALTPPTCQSVSANERAEKFAQSVSSLKAFDMSFFFLFPMLNTSTHASKLRV